MMRSPRARFLASTHSYDRDKLNQEIILVLRELDTSVGAYCNLPVHSLSLSINHIPVCCNVIEPLQHPHLGADGDDLVRNQFLTTHIIDASEYRLYALVLSQIFPTCSIQVITPNLFNTYAHDVIPPTYL